MASEFDTRTTQVSMSSPAVEKMLAMYEPKLAGILGGNINTAAFAPTVASQSQAQQEAMKLGLGQQGFSYDPATGAVTQTGLASFQPYLKDATTAAGQIQGAGATALQNAASAINQMQGLAGAQAISGAADPSMQLAQADLAGARNVLGQNIGDFMSPYQSQVIDAALAEYDLDTSNQFSQLQQAQGMRGTLGGGRGEAALQQALADRGRNRAALQADLLTRGYQQAASDRNQQAANLMGLSAQQAGLGESLGGLRGQDITALQSAGTTQGQLAGSQMSPFQNALAAQTQLASLAPSLGAQQFGVLSAFGDQQQKQTQAGLDALAQTNKLAQYAPYEQLGFVGQQISGLMGGYGTGTSIGTTAGPQPTSGQSLMAGLGTGAGILSSLGGLFGG
tara:strand:+ start:285 stop:1463 length:1179 start_codon:yes stop_codon:yes gene_type:complete